LDSRPEPDVYQSSSSVDTAIEETVWLGDTPVAVVRPAAGGGSEVFFVWTDQLDTPRVISDDANRIRWEWDANDPFGNNAPNEDPSGMGAFTYNLRFPGQYFDAETGLDYNYFRDYDPSIGRYIKSDPIGLAGGLSTFAYSTSNPLVFADPLGLYSWGEFGDDLSNAAVGFGDGVSFGATKWYRNWRGIEGNIDRCSGLYRLGDFVGAVTAPVGRLAYIAKVSKLALKVPRTVEEAIRLSEERNALKREFRSIARGLIRDYKDAAWASRRFSEVGAERFAASAGKTNSGFDALAGFGILKAAKDASCDCLSK
jgi:RHS repeat-associated protein